MPVRTVCLLTILALAPITHAQERRRVLFAAPAPKPKVVATPTPAPSSKRAARAAAPASPAAAPANPADAPAAATTPKPTPRKRKAADPMAAYMPTVKAAFSLRWGEAVNSLMKDFVPGNVSVLFKLDAEGKVTDFTVTQNTSNEAFAKFCEQFVRETTFEKPPEKALADGTVEIPFTFWIY
jgi:TonB family protein